MIQIQGLTKRQRAIADVLWAMNSKEQVLSFIKTLTGSMRRDAETVVEMMLIAIIDEVDSVAESQQYLSKFRLTSR